MFLCLKDELFTPEDELYWAEVAQVPSIQGGPQKSKPLPNKQKIVLKQTTWSARLLMATDVTSGLLTRQLW